VKAKINKHLYQSALTLWGRLQQDFPQGIFPPGQEKPLAIGLNDLLYEHCQLRSPGMDRRVLNTFLALYSSSIFYRAALMAAHAMRIDLAGNELYPVSSKDRIAAKLYPKRITWLLDPADPDEYALLQQWAQKKQTGPSQEAQPIMAKIPLSIEDEEPVS
jgi:hypothetical protein